MAWNWELETWPEFKWQPERLRTREQAFIENAAIVVGTMRHLEHGDREELAIELLSSDALCTSAIEGEVLDRDSVQSSLRRQLGISAAPFRSRPAEAGIAEMMADLYRNPHAPLTGERLFEWHRMVMNGRRDVVDIGRYRRMTNRCRSSRAHLGDKECISRRRLPIAWTRRWADCSNGSKGAPRKDKTRFLQ